LFNHYGTHGKNTSHTEEKWFKDQPQGMFKMTITTQAVSQTCTESKWSTLEQRSNQASLTMLYKIHNKQVNVDHSHLTTTRNNEIPHYPLKTKHHMNSFFPRAIRLWNKLPTEISDAPTVPAFASFMVLNQCFN